MALSIQSLTVYTIEAKLPIGFDSLFVTLVGVSRDEAYIGLTLEKSTCLTAVVIILTTVDRVLLLVIFYRMKYVGFDQMCEKFI